jgi:hypothetical protein
MTLNSLQLKTKSSSQDSIDDFNFLCARDSSRESSRGSQQREFTRLSSESTEPMASTRKRPFSLDRLGEDPNFERLCLQAARSLHHTQGVEFDEKYTVSIFTDIQVSVVELKLPLGCKFSATRVVLFFL